jgi:hypothetical protein
MSQQTLEFTIPSDPKEREKVFAAIKEISDSLTRIEAERELINETLNSIQENFEIPKKILRKVSRAYHKQNIKTVEDENETIVTFYEAIVP